MATQITNIRPTTPRLPGKRVSRPWPFRVAAQYLGGMPADDDIVGSLFPHLFVDQVWGDCCAYAARHVAQPAAAAG